MSNSDNDVELFIKLASVRNVLDRAWLNTEEAQFHLNNGDFASAIERFGVAHEDLRETSTLAKGFPNIEQTAKILENPRYMRLLDFLEEVENNIVEHCPRGQGHNGSRNVQRTGEMDTFLDFPPLPKLPKPPWMNGS